MVRRIAAFAAIAGRHVTVLSWMAHAVRRRCCSSYFSFLWRPLAFPQLPGVRVVVEDYVQGGARTLTLVVLYHSFTHWWR